MIGSLLVLLVVAAVLTAVFVAGFALIDDWLHRDRRRNR